MTVRPARPEDANCLATLAMQVWLHTYATEGISATIADYVLTQFSAERFAVLLSRNESAILVAEENGNLVGYALMNTDAVCPVATNANVELATLYVQAYFIGKGIGSALLTHAERWAMERTDGTLWLTVKATNVRAIAFYRKHRYTTLGSTAFRLGNEDHENFVLAKPDATR